MSVTTIFSFRQLISSRYNDLLRWWLLFVLRSMRARTRDVAPATCACEHLLWPPNERPQIITSIEILGLDLCFVETKGEASSLISFQIGIGTSIGANGSEHEGSSTKTRRAAAEAKLGEEN